MRRGQRGQAQIELALGAMLMAMLGLMAVTAVFVVRARSQAIAAAYACAQFLSQSPDPARAARMAGEAARRTLEGDWSAAGIGYAVTVTPGRPGESGRCTVRWTARLLFARLFGLPGVTEGEATFVADTEQWKARWR